METRQALHPAPRTLAAFALNRLPADARERLQAHLRSCASCSDFLARTPQHELQALIGGSIERSRAEQSTPGERSSDTIRSPDPPVRAQTSVGIRPPNPAEPVGRPSNAAADAIPQGLREQSKYRIVRLLGRGGMGSVYEAVHELMDRRVAVKVINPELVDNAQAVQRFNAEVQAVSKLDHRNVARAYDAEKFGTLQAIIMEFVPGQTVYDYMKARLLAGKPLTVTAACRLVHQALVGLQHAHDKGIAHRDLKPQNLMLTRDTGIVKILDFGLAKLTSDRRGLTKTNVTMGTYEYMAPEQALDAASADTRADIYSLGCTLHYLLAGVLPFECNTDVKLLLAHQNEIPRPLVELRPDVPQEVSDLVARMLAKNPADRPQTAAEAAQILLPYAKGEVPAPAKPAAAGSAGAAGAEEGAEPGLAALFGEIAHGTRSTGGHGEQQVSHHPTALEMPFGEKQLAAIVRRWWPVAAIASAALLGGIVVFSGLFKVRTADGTIALRVSQPNAEVLVDGQTITVHWGDDAKSAQITVPPGKHRIEVKKQGFVVSGTEVTLEDGGHEILNVALESVAKDNPGNTPLVAGQPVDPRSQNPDTKPAPLPGSPSPIVPQPRRDAAGAVFVNSDAGDWQCYPEPSKPVELKDGLVVLDKPGSVLITRNTDYRDVNFTLELAADEGTDAYMGVRLQAKDNSWIGETSRILDDGKHITAGMQSSNPKWENGMRRAAMSYGQFFNLSMAINGLTMWVRVDGEATSGVTYNGGRFHTDFGALGIRLLKGRIRIKRVLVSRLNWTAPAGAERAAPTPPAAARPEPAAGAPAVSQPQFPLNQWVDVLRLVDTNSAMVVAGKWSRNGQEITVEPGGGSRIAIPVVIMGGYDLEVEFTRASGGSAVWALLPVGSHTCEVILSGMSGQVGGLNMVDGLFLRDPRAPIAVRPGNLQNGHRYRLMVSVRIGSDDHHASIGVSLDGKPYLPRWAGDPGSLSGMVERSGPDPRELGLGADQDVVTFNSARLKMLSGSASFGPALASENRSPEAPAAAAGSNPDAPKGAPPPLLRAPFNASDANAAQREWAKHLNGQVVETNSLGMKLALIPPGEFMMGWPESGNGGSDVEEQHRVRITKAFYAGVYAVTQEEYEKLMGTNPSWFAATGGGKEKVSGIDTKRFPVEQVSWSDATEFCRKLSEKEGKKYRLPTEAEWEYACRAGTTTPFNFGDSLNGDNANCDGNFPYGTEAKGNYVGRPTTVGSYHENAFGLYDMHGNVWQWCQDWHDKGYYANSPIDDPPGPASGAQRVARGGCWNLAAIGCASAYRDGCDPASGGFRLGFRVARIPADSADLSGTPSPAEHDAAPPSLGANSETRADPVQAHTVWTGNHGEKLTILERNGEKFKAILRVGEKVELSLSGKVAAGRISWQSRDVIPIKGGRGGNCVGTIGDDTITFHLSAFGGATVLRLQKETH